jgi:hypothetical protein
MTVNQVMINSLKKQFDELTTPERIRVPENIKFEDTGEKFGLISPNGKCSLSAMEVHGGVPNIGHAGMAIDPTEGIITDPLYLEPCKREDLKCGDVALAFDEEDTLDEANVKTKYYNVILNDDEYAYWNSGMTMAVSDCEYFYWYKVVR